MDSFMPSESAIDGIVDLCRDSDDEEDTNGNYGPRKVAELQAKIDELTKDR